MGLSIMKCTQDRLPVRIQSKEDLADVSMCFWNLIMFLFCWNGSIIRSQKIQSRDYSKKSDQILVCYKETFCLDKGSLAGETRSFITIVNEISLNRLNLCPSLPISPEQINLNKILFCGALISDKPTRQTCYTQILPTAHHVDITMTRHYIDTSNSKN